MVMRLEDGELEHFLELVDHFPQARVGVIGDLVADSYLYGLPCRLSREAPVIILRYEREEFFPGGAANTVSNLLSLGGRVVVVGIVGDDAPGKKLVTTLENMGADTSGIFSSSGWKTIAKSRILAGDYHTKKQQVLRIDQEPDREPAAEEIQTIEEKVRSLAPRIDAWVVSDYGYKLASPGIIRFVQEEAAKGKVVVADSRYRVRDFQSVTLVTPNEAELFSAYGIDHTSTDESVDRLVTETGWRLLGDLHSSAVLVTRGNRGMMLFEPNCEPRSVPISGTTDIVDVSGAGDTVVAAVTLALASRSRFLTAARLANVAAGVKVMKHGTLPVSFLELRNAAWRLAANGKGPSKN